MGFQMRKVRGDQIRQCYKGMIQEETKFDKLLQVPQIRGFT